MEGAIVELWVKFADFEKGLRQFKQVRCMANLCC